MTTDITRRKTDFRKTGRNIMLGIAAAAIMGTAACSVAPGTTNQQAAENNSTYVVTGIPLGVSADCGYRYCGLSIVIESQDGQKSVFNRGGGWISADSIYTIDAMVQAEMNDEDNEPITVILSQGDLKIEAVNIEGKLYMP